MSGYLKGAAGGTLQVMYLGGKAYAQFTNTNLWGAIDLVLDSGTFKSYDLLEGRLAAWSVMLAGKEKEVRKRRR